MPIFHTLIRRTEFNHKKVFWELWEKFALSRISSSKPHRRRRPFVWFRRRPRFWSDRRGGIFTWHRQICQKGNNKCLTISETVRVKSRLPACWQSADTWFMHTFAPCTADSEHRAVVNCYRTGHHIRTAPHVAPNWTVIPPGAELRQVSTSSNVLESCCSQYSTTPRRRRQASNTEFTSQGRSQVSMRRSWPVNNDPASNFRRA